MAIVTAKNGTGVSCQDLPPEKPVYRRVKTMLIKFPSAFVTRKQAVTKPFMVLGAAEYERSSIVPYSRTSPAVSTMNANTIHQAETNTVPPFVRVAASSM